MSSVPHSVRAWRPFAAALALAMAAAPSSAIADRAANYLPGTITFSSNVTLRAPVANRDGEPSVRVDVRGNCYVGAIRGVPAGVDLWRFDLDPASPTFDPGMRFPVYLGQPDAFLPQDESDPTTGGSDGGGDIDIAVSFPSHPDSVPVVTIVSLAAATISSAYSFDRGETFTLSPATSIPADDRQWIEATGHSTVYMMYRAPLPSTTLFVQKSTDHGLSYPQGAVGSATGGRPGYIDVDHASGRIYIAYGGLLDGALHVARSSDGGLTWTDAVANNQGTHSQLFDAIKVGDDGTVYVVWSNGFDIFLTHSTDGGVTWAQRVRVNDNGVFRTNVMPWLEAGSDGRVCVVWYGTTAAANNEASNPVWDVLFAQTLDARAATPTFRQQVVSDHRIHAGNVSLLGLGGNANRNLIDYFQVAFDPQGAAVIAFTDDSNDFDGHTYVTRQLDGPSLRASANGTGFVDPVVLPPPTTPDPNLPEVMDFLHDATLGLLQPIPADNAHDILWVDYDCGNLGTSTTPILALSATMKVSSLAVLPEATNWRMHFTANAPGGLSDRGDQFYFQMNSDNVAAPTFRWGTAVRLADGTLAYTDRGAADFGVFDPGHGTITIAVALANLNPFVTRGPAIADGSVLHGLRGSAFTGPGSRDPVRDFTRGGPSFTYTACLATATTLAMFTAADHPEGIVLAWRFTDRDAFAGVVVERAPAAAGPWTAIEVRAGRDGESDTALDPAAEVGIPYHYRLVATDARGERFTFGPVSGIRGVDLTGPIAAFAAPPAPNPASDDVAFAFRVGRPGFVEVAVLDLQGRRVRTIQAGNLAPGVHRARWDGRTDRFAAAPAGVYLVVLHTADGVRSERVAITR